MLFTKASEYALLASIYLMNEEYPQDVEKIASELCLSKAFLAKILQNLAKDGVLKSFKGAGGGFCLAKKANEITIKEITEAAEKHQLKVFVCSDGNSPCDPNRVEKCKVHPFFMALQSKVDDFLLSLTLADLRK